MKIFIYTCLSTAILSALATFLLKNLGLEIPSIIELIIIFGAALGSFSYFYNKQNIE